MSYAADSQVPDDGVTGWAADLMESLGALGAGAAIALENLFPPLPSEVVLPLAGFSASQGGMSLFGALAATTAGSVVGAAVLYAIGALLGRDRTVALAARVPLLKPADIEKAEAWFARHGAEAVFFGRMVPVVRSMISVPAGVERMRPAVFLALTAAGSALWNSAFVLAGYALGTRWHDVADAAGLYSRAVLAAAALAVVAFFARRLLRRSRERRGRRGRRGSGE